MPDGWLVALALDDLPAQHFCGNNCLAQILDAGAIPVGAGVPANTGAAGASHRVGFFAGSPAPTEAASRLRT